MLAQPLAALLHAAWQLRLVEVNTHLWWWWLWWWQSKQRGQAHKQARSTKSQLVYVEQLPVLLVNQPAVKPHSIARHSTTQHGKVVSSAALLALWARAGAAVQLEAPCRAFVGLDRHTHGWQHRTATYAQRLRV